MLDQLYAISKLLADFESVEQTVSSALSVAAEVVPLRSAILIEETDGSTSMVVWPPHGGGSDDAQRQARSHALTAYGYLVGMAATEMSAQPATTTTLPHLRTADDAQAPLDRRRFIVIPLVVSRRVFGALQLEGAAPLGKSDLVLVNAFANQLAIALDRHRAREREVAARERAEAATRKYEALVDNLDHAFVWEADARTLRLQYVSARAESLLGFRRQQWLEREEWLERIDAGDADLVRSAFRRAVAEKTSQRVDHRWLTSTGRVRWFHTRVHALEAGGEVVLQGVSIDVTPAKEAEKRLREQLAFTTALTASLGEGVLAVDLGGRVTVLNRAAAELLGWSEGEVMGGDVTRVLSWTAPVGAPAEHPLQEAIATGRTVRGDERQLTRRDGTRFPVRYVAAPIHRGGELGGAVLAFEDITLRRQAEETKRFVVEASKALGASLDRGAMLRDLARLVLPRLGDFCLFDVVAADGGLHRVACTHADPTQQDHLAEVFGAVPQPVPATHPVAQAIRTGASLLAPEVDEPWFQTSALSPENLQSMRGLGVRSVVTVPLTLGERRLGALTFCFAGSGRRHGPHDLALAEELARRAAFAVENGGLFEEAQQAALAREQVLAVVSHDLRTPLGTVLMSIELLSRALRGDDDRRLREGLERTGRAAHQMKRLIEDLLDAVSVKSGQLSIRREPTDPASLLTEAAASFEATARAASLRLEVEIEPATPEVPCDRARALQVLSNLIGNALKVTPAGGVVTLRAGPRGGDVLFVVSDTGPGIAPDQMPHLFERFWRGPEAGYQGTGLGLAISKGIVEAHGGRIWAESTFGEGATFSFTLPAR